MERFKQKFLTVGTSLLGMLLLAGGIAYLAITGSRRMPHYQGKPLDYWLGQMPVTLIQVTTNSGATNLMIVTAARVKFGAQLAVQQIYEQPDDCLRAMKTMGTNALPILLANLQTRDNPWKDRINKLEMKTGIKRATFEPAMWTRGKAIVGLEALQPLPESVRQELSSLSTNADPNIAASAKYVLLGKSVDFGAGATMTSATPVRH